MTDLIVLGRIDESFHQVAAAVVEEVLVRLGHAVQVREGPHQQMYPLLARGELQLFADSWLPGGHGTYWEQIRDRVVEVAPLFDGARFFWAVPGYVPADLVSRPARPDPPGGDRPDGDTGGAGHHARRRADDALAAARARLRAGRGGLEGVFPPPDRASLVAHRDAFERLPERTRGALRRVRLPRGLSPRTDVRGVSGRPVIGGASTGTARAEPIDHSPTPGRT